METEDDKAVKKPAYDPGWNDPPMFSYDSHTSQIKAEKRGNVLNKRVAFPLHSNSATENRLPTIDPTLPPQPCNLASLPPPPSSTGVISNTNAIITPPVSINESIPEKLNDFNEEEALSTLMTNFDDVLNSKSDNKELQEKADDIRKRLDVIRKMWKDNKFPVVVQQKILQLSEAVKSGDAEKADHLQKCLMVDHASLCSSWMAGVRHILHSL